MENLENFILGSLLISVGGTIVGLSTFNNSSIGAAAGVMSFPLAYLVMNGSNDYNGFRSLDRGIFLAKGFLSVKGFYFSGLVLGSLFIGEGLVIGAAATASMSVTGMMVSGVLVLSGYFISHESFLRGFLK